MNFGRMIKIRLERLNENEFPVAVAINDKYIVFARESLKIEEEKTI